VKSIVSSPVDVGASHLENATLRNRESRHPEQSLPTFFVSVDIEAFERDQKCITEIGISTLDTEDLIGTTSGGARSINWGEKIVSRHFRIREYGHLRNKAFVEGFQLIFALVKVIDLKRRRRRLLYEAASLRPLQSRWRRCETCCACCT
jgi:hypothetical protein